MPRRKKRGKEPLEFQNPEEDAESVSVRKKRRLEDAFIVISDSDGEEPEEENGLEETKTEPPNRSRCLAKRKIAQMTEEEQFALALKMSEQEAREVNSQEEEEEALLRKAIAESLNSCQGLFVEKTSEEGNSVPDSQSIAALTSKRSSVLRPECSADEITVCPETQLSSPEDSDLVREVSPGSREAADQGEIMADKEVGNRADAEKKMPASAFSPSSQVSCPLCDQGFPLSRIEIHAMYCNGLKGQDTVLTRSQREARSKNESGLAARTSSDTDKKEKCYICKSLIPFREYHCHVESCLQLTKSDQGAGVEESKAGCSAVKQQQQQPWPRSPKEERHNEGRLLSRLEQSEHKNADAGIETKSPETGVCREPSPGLGVAGCSRDMQSSLAHFDLDESPIKSFVSISEATDCLVDFKKQLSVRPGNQTRTRAGRGRRRKS
ncbi:BRCA1-A complex subunit RAP80 isoform X4 [Erinaceus europaeus]|uniref:BRCA1-A complex subunit RAP80 n=1 Tax=Erinaceus europaeus TaxID=9365 RepID=A0A1S3WDF6_ERIEU|nr:BRCA1-A complex subunit RAP80 isoform X4 [Erinaceus europaeus]